jgi:hypothetical protein
VPQSIDFRDMGALRKPGDSSRENLRKELSDLTPEMRAAVEKLIDDHKGETLENMLKNLIGPEKTKDLKKFF